MSDLDAAVARALELARRVGVDTAIERIEKRGARVLVELPAHVVWIALDEPTAARLSTERVVMRTLAGRLPVAIPVPVMDERDACVRTKVIGRPGLAQHRRAMVDAAIATVWGRELGALFAAVHTAVPEEELSALVAAGVPARPLLDLDDVRRAATVLSPKAVRLAERYEPGGARTFLHGDLGSHNVVVDETGRITGVFDFEEASVGDRHHELRWLPSYGDACLSVALDVYQEKTGVELDPERIGRLHALVALEQYGWGLREPQDHHRTGRTLGQTRSWAERAVESAVEA
jgi:aminoglycoside phosphotransferase (APT) family kinase protein